MYYDIFQSPLGEMIVAGKDEGLRYVNLQVPEKRVTIEDMWIRDKQASKDAVSQLKSYFAGELENFDLPLAPAGTEFQKKVWKALEAIPYGTRVSYKYIAEVLDKPSGSRAVGMANSKNPIHIIIPCHRVIGSDGKLTGYAHGLAVKSWLLHLEERSVHERGSTCI